MRKFYLFLTALVAFATSANASIKVLYNQNFEAATDVASTQWVSPSAAAGLSISGDQFGKFIRFTQSGNDRSAHLLWGTDLIKSENVASYTVSFDMSATAWGNNHSTTEYTIMSDETNCTKKPNNNFRANSANWLFDLTQIPEASGGKALAATGDQVFAINGDSAYTVTLSSGVFYKVTLDIDTIARTVDWKIENPAKEVTVASNTYTVPEGTSMIATGLYFLGARFNHNQVFDNIRVSTYVDEDVANNPSVALTGINNQQRIYKIQFLKGETLHLSFQGNELDPISFADCDGNYVWSNNPNFNPENEELVNDACATGTLVAWTTSGSATSEKISEEVSNEIIALPAAALSVTNVTEGFGKTYTMTVDNSSTPLLPTVFVDYTFTPSDGGDVLKGSDLKTGSSIEVPSKGTLELVSKAFGYGETKTTIVNDVEYAQSADYDFAHMTIPVGFNEDGKVTGNYATYGRLYGNQEGTEVVDETTGNTTYTKLTYNDIIQYTKKSSEWTDSILVDKVAFTAIPSVNVHIWPGVGLNLEGRKGDDLSGSWITSLYLTVNGLTSDDIVLVSSLSNYGSNSLHPVVATLDDYVAAHNAPITSVLKGNDQIALYRISDVIARILVMSPKKNATGISEVSVEENKLNADAPIYTISGVRVSKNNLKAGVYVQNGKKFVVR
ncbi:MULTISPECIES: hypothetical protein [Segatella]|jgi:hypothetical protein|uniref:Lipocalin-like domain-containing protein n=1 Tax=Segatella bryantii TaxID=77095 RepID=A0AA37HXD2_SEGBR|nr:MULTISPECIES: hypothetical protein [Segatella]UKK78208.1 hypothetical protein L6469_00425 [Segatella baroniae B14]GJG27497.1 hypothetical protein PRRU23_11970 [Segatella bryantii]SDL60861.1 hypothetical protein SAMN04487899_103179 [Segatella bryantii]SEP68208.1 hypothetical protein SAMN05444375_10283 [Segatella baroniae B14]